MEQERKSTGLITSEKWSVTDRESVGEEKGDVREAGDETTEEGQWVE